MTEYFIFSSAVSEKEMGQEVQNYAKAIGHANAEDHYPDRLIPRLDISGKAREFGQILLERKVIATDNEELFFKHWDWGYYKGYHDLVIFNREEFLGNAGTEVASMLTSLIMGYGLDRKDALARAYDQCLLISRQHHTERTDVRVILDAAIDLFRAAVAEFEEEQKEVEGIKKEE